MLEPQTLALHMLLPAVRMVGQIMQTKRMLQTIALATEWQKMLHTSEHVMSFAEGIRNDVVAMEGLCFARVCFVLLETRSQSYPTPQPRSISLP